MTGLWQTARPILALAAAALALVAAITWLALTSLSTTAHVSVIEKYIRDHGACATGQTRACRRGIDGFIAEMTTDERQALAKAVRPYLKGR